MSGGGSGGGAEGGKKSHFVQFQLIPFNLRGVRLAPSWAWPGPDLPGRRTYTLHELALGQARPSPGCQGAEAEECLFPPRQEIQENIFRNSGLSQKVINSETHSEVHNLRTESHSQKTLTESQTPKLIQKPRNVELCQKLIIFELTQKLRKSELNQKLGNS